jgi:prefoldin subunit 5
MATETFFFEQNASPAQTEFYRALLHQDESEALRYLLTITNSLEIWKKDMRDLQDMLKELEKDEGELRHEEHDLENLKKREELIRNIPVVLRRHFPGVFEKIERDYGSLDSLMGDLKEAETEIHSAEVLLKKKLAEYKRDMPFLFE